MIYIHKNIENTIITDSWTKFIPDEFDIYLDDVLIVNVVNLSNDVRFYEFMLQPELTESLQIREYSLKIYSHQALLKKELVQVIDVSKDRINKQIQTEITYKIYE
jgi:hypothetical protein